MSNRHITTHHKKMYLGIGCYLATLLAVTPAAAVTVPEGTCPLGTTSPSSAYANVCIKVISTDPCPDGTAEAFVGSDICLLDPLSIPKFVTPLVIPPVMPKNSAGNEGTPAAEYNIAVRQFQQQILPGGIWNGLTGRTDAFNATTVWSYGLEEDPLPTGIAPDPISSFNFPAYTIEAVSGDLDTIRWVNDLVDGSGNYLPHLFPVDQTLHWANPGKDCRDGSSRTDCSGSSDVPYYGPVPMVTHVHGAHVNPESDGYPEAWWLPAASNLPAAMETKGAIYDQYDRTNSAPGTAYYGYENDQPAATLWYHDHTLGMTRLNVYAGPAGFWLVRGGANGDANVNGTLPGPAPVAGEDVVTVNFPSTYTTPGEREKYREIPIVIQDRSFNPDGSLFYPEKRAFFEEINPDQMQTVPFINDNPSDDPSDIAPIWNPEAFFNTMVVNGVAWPVLEVAPERYRFRLLNGSNSRALNLSMFVVDNDNGTPNVTSDDTLGTEIPFYQIGAEQGFLPNIVKIEKGQFTILPGDGTAGTPESFTSNQEALRMMSAERADVIVDFSGLADGTRIRMINTAPDAPFGGFPDTPADANSSGQVMEFVVNTTYPSSPIVSTAPESLVLPAEGPVGPADNAASPRRLSLNEEESGQVCVNVSPSGDINYIPGIAFDANDPSVFQTNCEAAFGVPFAPKAALLGSISGTDDSNTISLWMDKITETPIIGDTEIWEIYNLTEDAHPIHLHLVRFQLIDRQALTEHTITPTGSPAPATSNETGYKDTVVAFPGQVTRIKALFDQVGLYVWHCHIVEHEDNEMMRPYIVRFDPAFPDIDQDGKLTYADAKLMAQEIGKPEPRNAGYDLNDDGLVNNADYTVALDAISPHRSLLFGVASGIAAREGAKRNQQAKPQEK